MVKKKALTMQQKKMKKLALEKERIEKERQLRLDHLEREAKNTEMSMKVLKKTFRETALKNHLPLIKADLEILWHQFEHTMDTKDSIISALLEDIEEDDVQRQDNLESHVEGIDNLLATLKYRMNVMSKRYLDDVKETIDNAVRMQEKYQILQQDHEDRLKTTLHIMEQNTNEYMMNAESDALTKLDEESDKSKDKLQLMNGVTEKQHEDVWKQFRQTLDDHETSTAGKRKSYLSLKERDKNAAVVIHRQMLHTQKLSETVRQLKEKMQSLHPKEMLSALMEERSFFLDAYCQLRHRLSTERSQDMHQLTQLAFQSNTSIRWLEEMVNKGERILKLAAICRKLETHREELGLYGGNDTLQEIESSEDVRRKTKELFPSLSKLRLSFNVSVDSGLSKSKRKRHSGRHSTSYYTDRDDEETEDEEKEIEIRKGEEEEQQGEVTVQARKEFNYMRGFWNHMAHVNANYARLLGHRQELQLENNALRAVFCRYLTGLKNQWDKHLEKLPAKKGGPNNITQAIFKKYR